LAQKLGGEIISADSRQVYKGLDIGTGKVTKKETGGIPHHLLDVASPRKQVSASDFERLATKAIEKIAAKNKLPVVVGGTGFYADALLGKLTLPDVPPNPALREKLEMKTAEELFSMLKKKDLRRATTIEPGHKRRLIRALEIAAALGKNPEPKTEDKYDVLWVGIAADEKTLKSKIRARLLARMKAGMLAEAKKLHKAGLSFKRMKELGLEYRFMAELLLKETSKEEMLMRLESAINDYARRQMRWFKRNPDIHWISKKSEALALAKAFISGYYIPR
jgi:tRNA dimethylallyltransferase